jgi:hypothetical protein
MTVIFFRDTEEAVRLANKNEHKLAAAIWTGDLNKALRLARRIRGGTVWVNDIQASPIEAPWGGQAVRYWSRMRPLGHRGLRRAQARFRTTYGSERLGALEYSHRPSELRAPIDCSRFLNQAATHSRHLRQARKYGASYGRMQLWTQRPRLTFRQAEINLAVDTS